MPAHRPADSYSPLYFQASVGSGGLTATFFMYLMFWAPHPNAPVPVFEALAHAFGTGSVAMQTGIIAAMLGNFLGRVLPRTACST